MTKSEKALLAKGNRIIKKGEKLLDSPYHKQTLQLDNPLTRQPKIVGFLIGFLSAHLTIVEMKKLENIEGIEN